MAALMPARLDWKAALRIMLGVALANGGGNLLGSLIPNASPATGGMWASISGIVVLQATHGEAGSAAFKRVLGTLIGAVLSWLYLEFFPVAWPGVLVCVFLTVLVCQGLRVPDNGRLGCITVLVVLVVAELHPSLPALANAGLRFDESTLGSLVALLVAWLWPYPAGH
ncbi:FUSC family protein [Crenobacter intestini]|uniref:Integral membrane bound transporter domain-containing protein n=1 Tax=Crenobacter intestini TaxID=2563443 RepID=A0A4T0UQE9_9NEIS|nr:FUSC family protein [Crenobacter intestini]TIC80595.1 hypothetical protein E5K04_12245 [Crenobacter intestini]